MTKRSTLKQRTFRKTRTLPAFRARQFQTVKELFRSLPHGERAALVAFFSRVEYPHAVSMPWRAQAHIFDKLLRNTSFREDLLSRVRELSIRRFS